MRRADIQVGGRYQVKFAFGSAVTCRVISKHFFGFLIREQHNAQWDYGDPSYPVYGCKWSWKFMEEL